MRDPALEPQAVGNPKTGWWSLPFVYMVECNDGTLYTGWSTDVEARVKTHNAGRGSVYCKRRRPVVLVYHEQLPTRSEAQRRELAIKRLPRRKKLGLVEQQAAGQPKSETD